MGTVMAWRADQPVPVLVDDDMDDALAGRLSIGSHGYAHGTFDGRQQLLHRYLLGLRPRDGKLGDHINGRVLDNRRVNLRVVTPSESSANVQGHGVSGFRGVYPMRNKWQAKGKRGGKVVCLGTFDSPEEAYAVASAWRRESLPGYVDRPP